MRIGKLDRRLLIEYKSVARDPAFNSEVITWLPLATVWANAEDVLRASPGGGEQVKQDIRVHTRPCRVFIRYRADITTDMRVTLLERNRVMQITSIAEFGRREATELMCEEYTV